MSTLTRPAVTAAPRARRGATVAAATAITVGIAAVAEALGVDLTVRFAGQEPMSIGLPMVLVTALAASVAGWLSLALLERVTTRARGIWTAVALVVLAVSLLPVMQVEAESSTKATLAALHFVVAAVLVPGLARAGRRP